MVLRRALTHINLRVQALVQLRQRFEKVRRLLLNRS